MENITITNEKGETRQLRFDSPRGIPRSNSAVLQQTNAKELESQLLNYFRDYLSKKLGAVGSHNPLMEVMWPMARTYAGLMRSIVCLSAGCFMTRQATGFDNLSRFSTVCACNALKGLREDLVLCTAAGGWPDTPKADEVAAQMLMLCLQSVFTGDGLTGPYRRHLDAMKEMMMSHRPRMTNGLLCRFLLQFVQYLDFSNLITNVNCSLHHFRTSQQRIRDQWLTCFALDQRLLEYLVRARRIRDTMR